MKIDLKEYLTNRHKSPTSMEVKDPGPVITISREYGCEANNLAERLAKTLEKDGQDWKIISKEILEESSRELHLGPVRMEQAFTPHEKNFIEEMFNGFSLEPDITDKRIHEIVRDVILSYARQGHVIIVGRGGVAITRDMKRSLHVRLMAPIESRSRKIAEKRKTTLKRAREIVSTQDQRRHLFIQKLKGEVVDDTIFDMVLNTDSLNETQILDIVLTAARSRKILP